MIPRWLILLFTSVVLRGAGTFVAVQPTLTEQDYRTEAAFRKAVATYFDSVTARVDASQDILLVLPEYLGTWLVAVDESPRVFQARDINQAMVRILIRHPFRFTGQLLSGILHRDFKGPLIGKVQRSIFLMKSDRILAAYQRVFSELARDYGFWLVAGSVLLPELKIIDGRLGFLADREGRRKNLMNQSVVFNPEGKAVLVAKKVHPIADELIFLDSAPAPGLQTVGTDLGRLGVLVCADSWYPECYAALDSAGVDILAVGSFLTPAELWDAPWRGYTPPDGEPKDVDQADKSGKSLEREMWDKYALSGRMKSTGARVGINSFLHGDFWGLRGGGQSVILDTSGVGVRSTEKTGKDILIFTLPLK